MSAVSAWLLSISGAILLSVLAEFVLPDGQINKYTKVIFSFVILLVVIMPLPNILGKNFDINKYFPSNDVVLQENYLEQVNLNKLTTLTENINQNLQKQGFRDVEVSINANIFADELEIYWIAVDISNMDFSQTGKQDKSWAKMKINEIIDANSILKDVEVRFDE